MKIRRYLFWCISALLLIGVGICFAQTSQNRALLLQIKSAIGPATQDYVQRGLETAAKEKAALVILQLDTPGGLEKSMQGMVKDILASPLPVIVYVAPSGARAASAGTYIVYASHIAAMAPGTHIGAATPVSIGLLDPEKSKEQSAMEKKSTQDAMASIRSLAELRHRNVTWAEQAVSQGASISATEALKIGAIDLMADDVSDLLTKINGRTILIQGQPKILDTTHISIQTLQADWRTRFLAMITDPNVAYILMMIGIWGLFFEFANPGMILPGVAGGICLILALYAFQLLPINYAALGLIGLGIIFLVTEAFVASFGVLGIGGIIALALGSILLFGSKTPELQIAWQLILGVCLTTGAFFLFVINIALKSRFRPVVTGSEELIGQEGVIEISHGITRVRILGELWQVRSEKTLKNGQTVKVIGIDGLVLIVV